MPTVKEAIENSGLELSDINHEINDAFAVQFLACAKELNLDIAKPDVVCALSKT